MNPQNEQPPNTLFSSSSCRYCKLFLTTLSANMMMEQFQVIDVEKTAFDVSKVKVVPTIVVNNNRAFSGREAFSWLQNEIANTVKGVESFGVSSAFTYIGEERAECSMSSPFVNIEDAPEATAERHSQDQSGTQDDLTTAMERLKAARAS